MKKLIFSLSALAALLLAGSCQRENLEPVQQGGTVTYTVQVPGALATKAVGDNELIYEVYRETQVSDETAKPIYEGTTTFSGNSVDLPLEFVKNQKFVVLFWAQKEGSKVYDIKDLRKVSISKAQKLTSNNFDAEVFAGNDLVENCASKKGGNVELVRPIAQLNIATDSEGLSLGTTPVELNKSYVKVTGLSATYNVYKGYGSTETANAVYGMTDVPTGTITVGTESYNYVAMNYIGFMPQSDITVDVDFTIQTSEGNINHTVSNVPVKANYKTNIIGNLISATDNYNVTLGAWGTEETNLLVVDSATGLKDAIDNAKEGEEITLTGDIDLSELFPVTKAAAALPIVIAEGKSVVLNLNGYRITTPLVDGSTTNHTYAFENHGELTIKDTKGNGKIVARGNFNYGKMTLESGTINACDGNGGYGVRNYEGAEFVMKGGTVATIYEDGDIPGEGYDASPIRVDEGAKAVINEGTITNVSNYTCALDNYGETIINAGTFTTIHTTLANSATMTINGGSFTCNGLEGVTAHALWAAAGTTTINGGTFNGKDNYNGFNVDASKGATVYIKGGEFLPVHSGSLYGEGTIVVTGGTFFDNPSTRLDNAYEVKEQDGKFVVVAKPAVAKIGEVGYWSLNAAVAAVEDGGTITLVANETFTENNRYDNGGWWDGLGYSGDKSFTIDLGGFTVSQKGALNDYLMWFKNDGAKANTITLKNGTMDAGTTAFCAIATSSSNKQTITINLENINLTNNNSNGAVVKVRGGSVLNVNAGTVIKGMNSYVGIEAVGNNTVVNVYDGAKIYQNGTSSYVGAIIGASYNATLNIYGGEGKSAKCGIIVMSTGATINVSGGEWTANNDGTVAGDNNAVLVSQNNRYETGWACKSILNVTGGTFKGGYNCYGMGPGVEADDAQINIKGGNFNADPANYVVAGYEVTENAGTYTVDKPAALKELEAALAKGGNVTLTNDVTLLESIKVENKVVLDLNGKTITAPLFSAFEVKAGGELTVKNGKIVAYESTVRAIGGKVTVESGEYTSTGTALDSPSTYRYSLDCREGGELIINGGTFKSNNGMINVGSSVTINGGKFENIVEKSMTRHFAYVSAPLTINDGEFYGKANSSGGGCFFCGAGAGGDIQVKGGKFTSLWTSGSVNRIFEVYFGGTINVTGGMFNTNGGIATFVTENTDEATKAAYPYVAK